MIRNGQTVMQPSGDSLVWTTTDFTSDGKKSLDDVRWNGQTSVWQSRSYEHGTGVEDDSIPL